MPQADVVTFNPIVSGTFSVYGTGFLFANVTVLFTLFISIKLFSEMPNINLSKKITNEILVHRGLPYILEHTLAYTNENEKPTNTMASMRC